MENLAFNVLVTQMDVPSAEIPVSSSFQGREGAWNGKGDFILVIEPIDTMREEWE